MMVQSKTVRWPSFDKCSKSWQWHTTGKCQICLGWSDRLKPSPVQRTAMYAIYVQLFRTSTSEVCQFILQFLSGPCSQGTITAHPDNSQNIIWLLWIYLYTHDFCILLIYSLAPIPLCNILSLTAVHASSGPQFHNPKRGAVQASQLQHSQ